ncbi:MAG: methyltransferase [Gammaproteobacteria bacterium HGW-Gammaproteobacteria-3]|nr:MAG: methyltransferase [Gammaproteobacteria bacterium HGW-Gammaproteobacteria-3]
MPSSCPLCRSSAIFHYNVDRQRDYYRCDICELIFVPPAQHLSLSREKAVYDQHRNEIHDINYRKFLSRLFLPLSGRLKMGSRGLDYGCGPGPALAALFAEQGFSMSVYDPFYANQPEVLQPYYDFISCTEVAEHFVNPEREFRRLFSLLRPGGWLGLMTKLSRDKQAFIDWHYKNDPTHISFYSKNTFQWLARQYPCRLEIIGDDVILLEFCPS